MIKLINVNKIHHHPDNPRKDLGDLTELADSIKQRGILQNLTLVPWFSTISKVGCDDPKQQEEMGYYAVIGNRRLAAAKLAGLTEVPCVISDMDHKTQIGTMLLENMQRIDLTVYEQAQGFQMMLNLGETIPNISEKTGFSESTVRRRMKLLELDQDKLKEAAQRGATLIEYAELEKIEDIELRNKVLETIGTGDFNYKLRQAIDEEKRQKVFAEIIEQLKEFAVEIKDTNGLIYEKSYGGYGDKNEVIKPQDAGEIQYFYKTHPTWIGLYKERIKDNSTSDTKEQEENAKRDQDRKARYTELEKIARRSYELRKDFIKEISNTKARKHIDKIIEAAVYAMVERSCNLDYVELSELMNIDVDKEYEEVEWEDISKNIWKQPELNLLLIVYETIDSDYNKYFDWECKYRKNGELDYIYKFLEELGYRISKEEQAIKNGTHELFVAE